MSLKGDKYETVEEAQMRLQGSVVLYDGDPVYITRVERSRGTAEDGKDIARVFCRKLPLNDGEEEMRKYISSKKFELAPFNMGYMNFRKAAHHVSRSPRRQGAQGLTDRNAVIKCLNENPGKLREYGRTVLTNLIQDKSFIDMVKGVYPDLKQAMEALQKDHESIALSRTIALDVDKDLDLTFVYHNSVKCGYAFRKDKGITIPPKFKFLMEELEECRIPLA